MSGERGRHARPTTLNDQLPQLRNNTGFLRAERNLLQNRGWTYNPATTLWSPPVP